MNAVEKYTSVLALNMPQTFTQPFDAVHDNIGMSLFFFGISMLHMHTYTTVFFTFAFVAVDAIRTVPYTFSRCTTNGVHAVLCGWFCELM